MIYVYVFPKKEFDRNIADNDLISAFFQEQNVEKYTLEEFINKTNDKTINLDTRWIKTIDDNAGYYPVTSLHIDDLESSGFDVSNVTETDMLTLADKLCDSYLDWYFWESLGNIADYIGIHRSDEESD